MIAERCRAHATVARRRANESGERMAAPARVQSAVGAVCLRLNSVRSPMAASLLQHMFPQPLCEIRRRSDRRTRSVRRRRDGRTRPGHSKHRPMTFEDLEDWEGLNFDLIITLSPEAHHKALELTRTLAADVEYWPTPDPTSIEGSREQRMQAYRDVCDGLLSRIRKRFARGGGVGL